MGVAGHAPTWELPCYSTAFLVDGDLLEVDGGVFADGADEIVGEVLAVIDVAADFAAPDSASFTLGRSRFRLRLYVLLVIGVGGRWNVVELLAFRHFPDEHEVRSEVDGLCDLCAYEGVGACCDGQGTVCYAFAVGEVFELVSVSTRLEPEMFDEIEGGLLAEYGGSEDS